MEAVAFTLVSADGGRKSTKGGAAGQEPWPRHIGDLIDAELKKRNWSQEEGARFFGVAQSSVARWIDGSSRPRGPRLKKIADFVGIDMARAFQLNYKIPGDASESAQLSARLDAIEERLDSVVDAQKETKSEVRLLKEALAALLDRVQGARERSDRRQK